MTTGTTSVPQPSFGPRGFTIPETSAILAGVLADMQAAFGGSMNEALNTPQGQMASSLTAIIDDSNAQFLLYTNLVDPALSSGRMQDAIGAIYFLTRKPAEPTFVEAQLTGKPSGTVVIPKGALAQSTDGTVYQSTATVTINTSGTASVGFEAITPGPTACPAGTLTTIYQAIPGWDTITNAAAGDIGANVESAQAFELRRQQSVAQNSMGPSAAVQGAVLSVTGVLDAYTIDNPTNSPVTIQGQTIAANALYCCVAGGANADVAQAIWEHKAPGCAMTGSTTVTVDDENSGYAPPFPSYTIKFQRPTTLDVFFAVSIKNGPLVPSNALALVQQAIAETFAGTNVDPDFNTFSTRARIGGTIFATDYVSNLAQLGPWARVISVTIGSTNAGAATFTGAISGTTLTVSGVTGTIAAGQAVDGAGVAPNTIIVSGSGSTWTISPSQTVASEAMSSVAMTLADLVVNINQFPAIGGSFLTLV